MNRFDYDAAMRSRRKRQAKRGAASPAVCPFNRPPARGLFGASLRPHQVVGFARCVTVYGGEWIAFTSADRDTNFMFLSTVDFCRNGTCGTDHREGGRQLLADLQAFLEHAPSTVRVLHSRGWPHAGYQRRTG